MKIRNATPEDLNQVQRLAIQIGASSARNLTGSQLEQMINSPHHAAFICSDGATTLAFLGMQFVPGSDSMGNFAVISHFGLYRTAARWAAAERLEAHAAEIAAAHYSASVMSKASTKITGACRFYERQGYQDFKTQYIKNL